MLVCMYIKKVTRHNKDYDKTYEYLHLVENVRTPEEPRQRLILNLGKLDVSPDLYKELANCIDGIHWQTRVIKLALMKEN